MNAAVLKRELEMSQETRLAVLENTLQHINTTLFDIRQELKEQRSEIKDLRAEMKAEFTNVYVHFDSMNGDMKSQLVRVHGRIDSINDRLWTNFLWHIGIGVGLYGSMFGVIAHALKWI